MLKLIDQEPVQNSEEYQIAQEHLAACDGFICITIKNNYAKLHAGNVSLMDCIFNLEMAKQKYILEANGLIDFN